jgi:hypothetical protein
MDELRQWRQYAALMDLRALPMAEGEAAKTTSGKHR